MAFAATTCFRPRNRLRAGCLVGAVFLGFAVFAGAQDTPSRVVLNAPNCAQEVENYRRECVRACESSLIKPQCARSCNDPNKLSPRLAACEQRNEQRNKKPA
jgi:hypothetical protein